jgi:hypothetical protein
VIAMMVMLTIKGATIVTVTMIVKICKRICMMMVINSNSDGGG